jgi:hypothetical protein
MLKAFAPLKYAWLMLPQPMIPIFVFLFMRGLESKVKQIEQKGANL